MFLVELWDFFLVSCSLHVHVHVYVEYYAGVNFTLH